MEIIKLWSVCKNSHDSGLLDRSELPDLPPIVGQSEALSVEGSFVGIQNDTLIITGGVVCLQDVYEFHPVMYKASSTKSRKMPLRKRKDVLKCAVAGTAGRRPGSRFVCLL